MKHTDLFFRDFMLWPQSGDLMLRPQSGDHPDRTWTAGCCSSGTAPGWTRASWGWGWTEWEGRWGASGSTGQWSSVGPPWTECTRCQYGRSCTNQRAGHPQAADWSCTSRSCCDPQCWCGTATAPPNGSSGTQSGATGWSCSASAEPPWWGQWEAG